MKVTKVTPWLIRTLWPWLEATGETPREGEYLFVQVDTDAGLTGWGEITVSSKHANRLARAAVEAAAPLLVGRDPSRIEALWHLMFREFTYLGTGKKGGY